MCSIPLRPVLHVLRLDLLPPARRMPIFEQLVMEEAVFVVEEKVVVYWLPSAYLIVKVDSRCCLMVFRCVYFLLPCLINRVIQC